MSHKTIKPASEFCIEGRRSCRVLLPSEAGSRGRRNSKRTGLCTRRRTLVDAHCNRADHGAFGLRDGDYPGCEPGDSGDCKHGRSRESISTFCACASNFRACDHLSLCMVGARLDRTFVRAGSDSDGRLPRTDLSSENRCSASWEGALRSLPTPAVASMKLAEPSDGLPCRRPDFRLNLRDAAQTAGNNVEGRNAVRHHRNVHQC